METSERTFQDQGTLAQVERMITFHGEVFPDNAKWMFLRGMFTETPEPEREVDIVIVGGGAGGLTAAYRLKERNILLLEALSDLGGNAMYGEWEGVPFSLSGISIGKPGTWSDSALELCRELDLPAEEDTSSSIAAFPGSVLIPNPASASGILRAPLPWRVKRDIIRYFILDMPRVAVEARKQELDRIPFTEFLGRYSPEFRQWFDLRAKPYPRARDVSTYFALWTERQKYALAKICSFPGGLGLISRTLAQKVEEAGPGRILTNAFVYKIRHDADGRVQVTYWHQGKASTVRARVVLINAEANIAKQILQDIPQPLKEAMDQMVRYSYVVFHFCSHRPIYHGGYRIALNMAYPITAQDWFSGAKSPDRPNILSFFYKIPAEDADLVQSKDEMVRLGGWMLHELEMCFPGAMDKVSAVHAFLRSKNAFASGLGYVTQIMPKLGKPFGSIYFANAESISPLAHFDDAIMAGNQAAEQALRRLAQD